MRRWVAHRHAHLKEATPDFTHCPAYLPTGVGEGHDLKLEVNRRSLEMRLWYTCN